jgi:DNA-directed RNA polymerase specialized sigma subunit
MKTIMQMKFVDNLPLEKIGDKLGYDKSSISKKIDRFLKNIEHSTNSTL